MRARKTTKSKNQLDLSFFFTREEDLGKAVDGAGPFDRIARRLFLEAIEGWERHRIAEELSTALGRDISKVQVDQWAAPSQRDRRVPVDALIATIQLTGNIRPLQSLEMHFGRVSMTREQASLADFGAMALLSKRMRAEQSKLETVFTEKMISELTERLGVKGAL